MCEANRSSDPEIKYEDRHMLICVKPAGVLAESDGKGKGFPDRITAYLVAKGEDPTVCTVHRLDRDVGGLTAVARSQVAAGKLSAQIAAGEAIKEYVAVLRGIPTAPEGILRDYLFRDAAKGKTYVVDRIRKGVREAALSYRLIAVRKNGSETLSLVRIRLHTGRTHQIRVQFASRSLPLCGDGRYGSRDGRDRPALFAYHLCLRQPFKHKKAEAYALPPMEYPFSLFEDELRELIEHPQPFAPVNEQSQETSFIESSS